MNENEEKTVAIYLSVWFQVIIVNPYSCEKFPFCRILVWELAE